jgi:hypothetical protein
MPGLLPVASVPAAARLTYAVDGGGQVGGRAGDGCVDDVFGAIAGADLAQAVPEGDG